MNELTLKEVIIEDCKTFENQINKDMLFDFYLYLNKCENSDSNGLYQLIFNGCELWYGTLAEINAVVKSLCRLSDDNAFDKYTFTIKRRETV